MSTERRAATGRRSGTPGRARARLVLPLGMMAAIWFASSLPGGAPGIHGLDKLIHAAVFGVLAGLWLFALAPTTMRPGSWVTTAVLLAASWGIVDELHQSRVPTRTASIADAVADAVGASCVGVAAWLGSRRQKHAGGRPDGGKG